VTGSCWPLELQGGFLEGLEYGLDSLECGVGVGEDLSVWGYYGKNGVGEDYGTREGTVRVEEDLSVWRYYVRSDRWKSPEQDSTF